MDREPEHATSLNIAAVARDTGLTRDTLRVWERRYGFPAPDRDEHGERLYSAAQVAKLRLIRRLLDQGLRPAKIVRAESADLRALLAEATPVLAATTELDPLLLSCVRMNRSAELGAALRQALLKQGLQRFVADTVAPLNQAIGEAWLHGEIGVAEEHLYCEQVQNVLRGAIGAHPSDGGHPRVLLTTLPDEQHVLGLLMVEATLVPEGASCLSLGTRTPLSDIVQATSKGDFDVVGLSFSAAYPLRQALAGLQELRALLAPGVALWAGGAALSGRQKQLPSVRVIEDLADVLAALAEWRAAQESANGDAQPRASR